MKDIVQNRFTVFKLNARLIIIYLVVSVFMSTYSYGQSKDIYPATESAIRKKIVMVSELQILRSTHANLFSGGSLVVGYYVKPLVLISIGSEYSYAPSHVDNGWDLFNLKMIPIFIDGKFFLTKNRKVIPFIQVSQGVSFVNYRKEDQFKIFTPYMVSEKGYYVYGGAGASVRITKKIDFLFGVGIKSFHLSLNALEVNPHGVSYRFGFGFEI